mgnify:CR=1 FL=1
MLGVTKADKVIVENSNPSSLIFELSYIDLLVLRASLKSSLSVLHVRKTSSLHLLITDSCASEGELPGSIKPFSLSPSCALDNVPLPFFPLNLQIGVDELSHSILEIEAGQFPFPSL